MYCLVVYSFFYLYLDAALFVNLDARNYRIATYKFISKGSSGDLELRCPHHPLSPSLSLSLIMCGGILPHWFLDTFRLYPHSLSCIVICLTRFAQMRSSCTKICRNKWVTWSLNPERGGVDELINLNYFMTFARSWAQGVSNTCLRQLIFAFFISFQNAPYVVKSLDARELLNNGHDSVEEIEERGAHVPKGPLVNSRWFSLYRISSYLPPESLH